MYEDDGHRFGKKISSDGKKETKKKRVSKPVTDADDIKLSCRRDDFVIPTTGKFFITKPVKVKAKTLAPGEREGFIASIDHVPLAVGISPEDGAVQQPDRPDVHG